MALHSELLVARCGILLCPLRFFGVYVVVKATPSSSFCVFHHKAVFPPVRCVSLRQPPLLCDEGDSAAAKQRGGSEEQNCNQRNKRYEDTKPGDQIQEKREF